MTTLVRAGRPDDRDVETLQTTVANLERLLRRRAEEAERCRLDLAAFTARYRQEVGLLHDELDDLERAIAEAELGELPTPAGDRTPRAGEAARVPAVEPAPRYTSDAVRKLFRDVAKALHPDLAQDPHARDRRHRFMVEANRAYSVGDEERLRGILQSWERSPEAVVGHDLESTRQRLVRRAEQIEEELARLARELAAMKDSPMWTLKVMVDDAAGKGRNLVGEMVGRLKHDIMVARNRLDAIVWTP